MRSLRTEGPERPEASSGGRVGSAPARPLGSAGLGTALPGPRGSPPPTVSSRRQDSRARLARATSGQVAVSFPGTNTPRVPGRRVGGRVRAAQTPACPSHAVRGGAPLGTRQRPRSPALPWAPALFPGRPSPRRRLCLAGLGLSCAAGRAVCPRAAARVWQASFLSSGVSKSPFCS